MKEFLVIYDFVLTNGDDRGSFTEDWEVIFEGNTDDFSHKDFGKFDLIDTTVDNSSLSIPIGTEVYAREWDDNILIYQGNPIKEQINEGMNPFIMNRDVWATEDKVIPVSTVKVKDYADRMETFPPSAGLVCQILLTGKGQGRKPQGSHGRYTEAVQTAVSHHVGI